jgi:superoxide dismutase, Fe-Mn family
MPHPTRRHFLRAAGAGTAALALAPLAPAARAADKPEGFTLPRLPYAFDALEPYIDAKTMEIHHDRHHQAYVTNLNTALKAHPELFKKSVKEILVDIQSVPQDIRQAVINNGGGHANHSMFWLMMRPNKSGSGTVPNGEVAKAIDDAFGSFDKFQAKFSDAGAKRFGSGWAWLVTDGRGKLDVLSTANQDSPLMTGQTPLLGLDVWEHAYYLKYQNKRPDYIKAWWNVVNWNDVAERLNAAKKGA